MKKDSSAHLPEPEYGFSADELKVLLESRDGPCVSIYFPAHHRPSERRSDSILYRNLTKEVEGILQRDASGMIARKITASLHALDQPEFWERGSRGVAVFAAPDFFACFRLPMEVPTLEVVGGSFHLKPLLRYLQEGLSYHLLVLGPGRVELFEGWREDLQAVPLPGVPISLEEVLGPEQPGGGRGSHPRGDVRLHHAQGGGGDAEGSESEKYFREVLKSLRKTRLRRARRPLILAASRDHQAIVRRLASFPTLLEEGIVREVSGLGSNSLGTEAMRILEPEFERRVARAREEYALAAAKGLGSDEISSVARAAAEGRVRQLFVESGRRFWGLLDRTTGEIVPGEREKNAYDTDILAQLAEVAMARGGDVLVLATERMPSRTGIAATYRF